MLISRNTLSSSFLSLPHGFLPSPAPSFLHLYPPNSSIRSFFFEPYHFGIRAAPSLDCTMVEMRHQKFEAEMRGEVAAIKESLLAQQSDQANLRRASLRLLYKHLRESSLPLLLRSPMVSWEMLLLGFLIPTTTNMDLRPHTLSRRHCYHRRHK